MSAATHPLALSELVDYWLSELPQEQSEAVEEHLFECDACSQRLDALRATADAVVGLVRSGGLTGRATTALLNRFARDRMNIRQFTLAPGEVVPCTVAPHDDFLLGRLLVPPGEHGKLDISVQDDDGVEVMRIVDVAFDARAREVITFLPARPVQSEGSGRQQYVLLGEHTGSEIARYTRAHGDARRFTLELLSFEAVEHVR